MDAGIVTDESCIVVDCRDFYDAQNSAHLHGHIGLHPAVLRSVVDHPAFPRWFSSLHRNLMSRVEQRHSPTFGISIIFFCRSGKHRSVACRRIVEHIMHNDSRFHLTRVHDCTDWGKYACGACGECRADPAGVRLHALERASALWQRYTAL